MQQLHTPDLLALLRCCKTHEMRSKDGDDGRVIHVHGVQIEHDYDKLSPGL